MSDAPGAKLEPPDDEAGRSGRVFVIRGRSFAAPALPAGLYIVATPIGNLGDVTLRALETLAGADLVACEDTRVTRKLLARYGIQVRLTAYHEHSGPEAHARLMTALAHGSSVAMVSDAGTPLISDPGSRLVADAAAAGHKVIPIPGASAAITALAAAGLPTGAFLFLGFLPSRSAGRRKRLAEFAKVAATLVLYESPNRIAALLGDAADILGGERPAALCRELTKLHETFDRGTLAELRTRYAGQAVRGEIVLAVAPPGDPPPPGEADVEDRLRRALATMSVKEAAQAVAAATGLPRRDLYGQALRLKADG